MCSKIREYIEYKRVVKFGILRKSALTELLFFALNPSNNFLDKDLGMKRGISETYPFSIHFPSWLPN